ncbi:MAG: ABC transporter permease [Actinobacteria bacterium]|nr:ABC transporter permease [Actinomycetota bacterium]
MLKLALRNLRSHKLRLVITAGAIVLGVGFVAGTFVLTDTLGKVFDDLIDRSSATTDVVVRGKAVFDSAGGDPGESKALRADLDPALLDRVRGVDGVKAADLAIVSATTQVLRPDGKPIAATGNGPPTLGFNWSDVAQLNPWTVAAGRPPRRAGEIAIDRATFRKGKLRLGSRVLVRTPTGPVPARVVGVLTFGGQDNAVGASAVAFDRATAIRRLSPDGKVQEIDAIAAGGVSQTELVARVKRAVGRSVDVVSGQANVQETKSSFRSQLRIFNTVLGGFAGVSLLAGTFIIYNTFGIIVAQRTRELALLRALGAAGRQVFTSVVVEAAVTGLLASLGGLVFGLGVAWLLKLAFGALGVDLPSVGLVVTGRTVAVALVAGLATTTLSAVVPARRASRVAPMAAMRESAIEHGGASRRRTWVAGALLGLGAALMISAAVSRSLARVAFGGVLLFFGAIVLGPVLATLSGRTLGRLAPGITGRLARENVIRNPRRSASTAASLILALTVITLFTIFSTSFGASINAATARGFRATFQVTSGAFQTGGLPPAFAEQVRSLDGVAAVSGIRRGTVGVAGGARAWFGVSGRDIGRLVDLQVEAGRLEALGPGTIAVDRTYADRYRWKLGSEVRTRWVDGSIHPLRVVAIYGNGDLVAQGPDGHLLVDQSVFDRAQPAALRLDNRVLIEAAPGVPRERLRQAIERTGRPFGAPKVQDLAQIQADQSRQINQQLAFFVVLLGLSVIIGAIGIVNTLVLSVLERTREIGLLRAVGAERGKVATTVLFESVLVAIFGTIVGFVLGTSIGSALMLSLRGSIETARISIPIPVLVVYAVVAVVIGTAAGLYPAWRAARLDVLRAITVE